MTKTLTEQWREGKLQLSRYYAKFSDGSIDNITLSSSISLYESEHIKEVLAPVPSYEEICHLNKRLGELAKDIDELHSSFPDLVNDYKRLQEQLKEANEVIKLYDSNDFHYQTPDGVVMGAEPAHKYLLKWGVK